MKLTITIQVTKDGSYASKKLAESTIEATAPEFLDSDILTMARIAAGNVVSTLAALNEPPTSKEQDAQLPPLPPLLEGEEPEVEF